MKKPYLKIPLDTAALVRGRKAPTSSLETAINEHIMLLLNTRQHEYRFGTGRSSPIPEQGLRISTRPHQLKADLEEVLQRFIAQNETRLTAPVVEVNVCQQQSAIGLAQQVLEIHVNGQTISSGQPLHLEYHLDLSEIIKR